MGILVRKGLRKGTVGDGSILVARTTVSNNSTVH